MKLVYWVCVILDDVRALNIRTKTKKDAAAQRAGSRRYSEPKKVTIEYADAFDLMEQCMSTDHYEPSADAAELEALDLHIDGQG